MFRVFYKKILMDKYVKLSTLKVLQDRYIYFCESSVKYKEIILESYLDEIREILIQVQKLPFGNN